MRKHWTILLALIVCGIFTSAAQNRITIKGEVFDENNEPFIGVMIANMTQKEERPRDSPKIFGPIIFPSIC